MPSPPGFAITLELRAVVAVAILAVHAAAPTPAVAADAGQVLFVAQGLSAQVEGHAKRVLERGSTVVVGAVLRSGGGHAQLRLADGAMVSLAPESAFRIDALRVGAAEESPLVYLSLLEGGLRLRAAPGGARFDDRYRLRTWAADLVVRGATLGARLCRRDCADAGLPDLAPGLHLVVERGEVVLFNAAGRQRLRAGDAAVVRDYRSEATVSAQAVFR